MNLNEVAPGVFRLGNNLFNWFLIKDGNRYTLLDSGLPGYYGQLVETLKQLNAKVSDIEAVLLTHAHLDHVGLAERIRREANATIYLHEADQNMARWGGLQLPPVGLLAYAWRRHPFRILTSAVRRNVFFGSGIRTFKAVRDGQTVDVPGQPKVIETPGHTAGSVSFWLPERQTFFAGDALVTINMLSGKDPLPQLTPRNVGTDPEQSLNSLNRMVDLGKATLLTGHGEPWRGQMTDAVGLARQRADDSGDVLAFHLSSAPRHELIADDGTDGREKIHAKP